MQRVILITVAVTGLVAIGYGSVSRPAAAAPIYTSATVTSATPRSTTDGTQSPSVPTPPRLIINLSPSTPWYAAPVFGAIVWPLVILAITVLVLFTRRGRYVGRQIAGRVGRVDAFGLVGLDLTRENRELIRGGIEGLIDEYRDEAARRFEILADRYELKRKLRELAEKYVKGNLREAARDDFRCAIYVQDLVFRDGIYQIIDYYPDFQTGAGRVIGKWFGHVGRAFRSGESRTAGRVTTDVRHLVDEYGMTPEEAKPKPGERAKESFSCVMITPEGGRTPVGGIYVDAGYADAFEGSNEAFEAAVTAGAREVGLTAALSRIYDEIISIGLSIDVRLRRDPKQ